MSVSLFKKKSKEGHDELGLIPPPGTPPTKDEFGKVLDPGNPWIGPNDPKLGYPTEGYSQKQLRRIRRAEQRRQAAEVRVASRNYAKAKRRSDKFTAFKEQRIRILTGVVPASPGLLTSIEADQRNRAKVTQAYDTLAQRQDAKDDRREDALDARRIARFKAGHPRGKDLREEVMNQYSSFLPAWYWLPIADEALES